MKPGKDFIGIGCGAIIVNDKDEVLLLKRSSTARTEPITWSRPGGAVEFGEKIEEAVVREVEEETGVKIQVLKHLEITQNIEEDKHWIAHGYLARHLSGEPKNMEPTKHDEIRWFPVNELPEKINNYTKKSIELYIESKKE